MQNFADQCLDMARSLLGHNLNSINADGSIAPVEGEASNPNDPSHAALAIGEFYRATGETRLNRIDLVDLCARCVTAQTFTPGNIENGLAYVALALLSFGSSKDRNTVWERLLDDTRHTLDKRLLERTDALGHFQAFNIGKAVVRYSMGLSKKDETGILVDRFIERLQTTSTGGFMDDRRTEEGLGGVFDVNGLHSFVFIRQVLQLHGNPQVRERKLPTLRTYAEKYIKMMPSLVRADGLCWAYGSGIGAYGQMYAISLLLQAMRDGWVTNDTRPYYLDLVCRMFQNFFITYLDREHGFLVVRDHERNTVPGHTTRQANFDAARSLCQWARLAKTIGGQLSTKPCQTQSPGRFVVFDKSAKKEQGLFIYHDQKTGLHIQLPLVGGGKTGNSDSLAFPHAPGIFDWPVNQYLPILVPELKFGEHVTVPSFYGIRCSSGLGLKDTYYFKYEQPELITSDERIVPGLASCKVNWSFSGSKITSEFAYTVAKPTQLDSLRVCMAIGLPHSHYRLGSTLALGSESLRAIVVKDDFQCEWAQPELVSEDPNYKTYYGKLHYIQMLKRNHPLIMRPGQTYRLTLSYEPDVHSLDALLAH